MNKKTSSLKKMILISLLAALGFLIMLIAFPVPLFPVFLTMDFSDIPALIGTVILGPGAGIAIEGIKNILHVLLAGSLTVVPVGELANFTAGSILILVTWWFYSRKPAVFSIVKGMIAGTVIMTVLMAFANYYLIFPAYAVFLGLSVDKAVAISQAANSHIQSLMTLVVYGVMPFNLIKGAVLTLLMAPLCIRLKNFIHQKTTAA